MHNLHTHVILWFGMRESGFQERNTCREDDHRDNSAHQADRRARSSSEDRSRTHDGL